MQFVDGSFTGDSEIPSLEAEGAAEALMAMTAIDRANDRQFRLFPPLAGPGVARRSVSSLSLSRNTVPRPSSSGTGFPGVTDRSVSPFDQSSHNGDAGSWPPVSRMSVRTTTWQRERDEDAEMVDDEDVETHTARPMTIRHLVEPMDRSGWAGLEDGMYHFGPDDSPESVRSGVGEAGTPRVFNRET